MLFVKSLIRALLRSPALCLSPLWRLPLPASNEAANELSPKKAPSLARWSETADRPYRRRDVFVFSAAARLLVKDFLPRPQAPCHVPRQPGRSYDPVGFNGAGEDPVAPEKKKNIKINWSVWHLATSRFPPSVILFN